jgi:tetratricopeptide (TPR) repeat protein
MILVLILWLKRDSWARPAFFSFSYYLVVLSPFLGLIDQTFWRYSFVEDHLQYLAAMGPLALLGAGLIRVAEFVSPNHTWRQTTLCSAILLILGMLSWQRALVFENSETLWTDALAKNRNCWAAYNNLGQLLLQNGYVDAAMADYQKALSINPSDAEALSNVGVVLLQKGHTDAAVAVLQKALKINPRDAEAYNNLGNAFLQKGSSNDAITQYRNALKMNPFYDEAHNNLGVALSQNGQLEEGISQFEEALRLNPNFSGARQNLANAQAIVQHAPETK